MGCHHVSSELVCQEELNSCGEYCLCKMVIKPIYLLSEIVSGLLFVFSVGSYGVGRFENGAIFVAWVFLSMLIIITVSDLYYQLILDKVLLFFGAVILNLYIIYPQYDLVSGIIGTVVGFVLLYAGDLLRKFLFKEEVLGSGDMKLYAIIGFVLGISNPLLSLFLSAVVALVFTLLFIKDRNKAIGFRSFIVISSYICLLF